MTLSCTSCGVKQSKDKQEAKKKITREGDYSYANSTDIEFVKSKFPNIEEIKSVSYIYEKKSNDREIGLEWIHFEGIINIGKNFSEKIAREYDWEPCDTIPNLSIKTKIRIICIARNLRMTIRPIHLLENSILFQVVNN